MANRSMTDVAFEFLQTRKKEVPFDRLWKEVTTVLKIDETVAMNKIASFYNEIMLDTRFTSKDNKWDLSERHKYSETHKEIDALDIDEVSDDDIDNYSDEEIDLPKENSNEDDIY